MALVKRAKKKTTKAKAAVNPVVLVATRKGAWLLHGDAKRKTWRTDGPHFLGHIVHHLVLDPRDGRTLLAAAKTGHLGPTVFRSTDLGRTWTEAVRPPAFAKAAEGEKGRVVDHTFWLTPGHADEPDVWYAGTSPQGLFRSDNGGASWTGVDGLNDDPQYRQWMGSEQDGTPDGPKLHSINVDPRDPRHLYMAMSSGGVHESKDRRRVAGCARGSARSTASRSAAATGAAASRKLAAGAEVVVDDVGAEDQAHGAAVLDGEPGVGAAEREQRGLGRCSGGHLGERRVDRAAEGAEARGRRRREQVPLVGEVVVRRGFADAGGLRHAPQRHAFGPVLLGDAQGRPQQGGPQISVVIPARHSTS